MVFVNTKPLGVSAADFAARALKYNIRVSVYGPTKVRLVTNHDVTREDTLYAADALVELVKSLPRGRKEGISC
jgi:hypothetical protein